MDCSVKHFAKKATPLSGSQNCTGWPLRSEHLPTTGWRQYTGAFRLRHEWDFAIEMGAQEAPCTAARYAGHAVLVRQFFCYSLRAIAAAQGAQGSDSATSKKGDRRLTASHSRPRWAHSDSFWVGGGRAVQRKTLGACCRTCGQRRPAACAPQPPALEYLAQFLVWLTGASHNNALECFCAGSSGLQWLATEMNKRKSGYAVSARYVIFV